MYTGYIQITDKFHKHEWILSGETYYVEPKNKTEYYVSYLSLEEEGLTMESESNHIKKTIRQDSNDGSALHIISNTRMRTWFIKNKIKLFTL